MHALEGEGDGRLGRRGGRRPESGGGPREKAAASGREKRTGDRGVRPAGLEQGHRRLARRLLSFPALARGRVPLRLPVERRRAARAQKSTSRAPVRAGARRRSPGRRSFHRRVPKIRVPAFACVPGGLAAPGRRLRRRWEQARPVRPATRRARATSHTAGVREAPVSLVIPCAWVTGMRGGPLLPGAPPSLSASRGRAAAPESAPVTRAIGPRSRTSGPRSTAGRSRRTRRAPCRPSSRTRSRRFTRVTVRVEGAGRTDTGVHADGQVVHFDLARPRDAAQDPRSLNNRSRRRPSARSRGAGPRLSRALRRGLEGVPLSLEPARPLFRPATRPSSRRSLRAPGRLGCATPRPGRGTRDFRFFAVRVPRPEPSVRTLQPITIEEAGDEIRALFRGDGFLRGMVRSICGVLADASRGRVPAGTMRSCSRRATAGGFHTRRRRRA